MSIEKCDNSLDTWVRCNQLEQFLVLLEVNEYQLKLVTIRSINGQDIDHL
jgi:hypothetical protein